MAAYMVINSIFNYFSYKVITTTRTIFEMPTLFPKVTFCNLNKYTTEYGFNTDDGNNLTIEQRKLLGHNLDDILINCWFNYQECNTSDFIWSYDKKYGNCFSFNAGLDFLGNKNTLKQSAFVGSNFGLYMVLYVNFYEKLLEFNSKKNGMGALIRIENSSYAVDHGFRQILLYNVNSDIICQSHIVIARLRLILLGNLDLNQICLKVSTSPSTSIIGNKLFRF